ncbi:MAG: hypothetical protein ICCCNLDF_02353 [Planctomycetes bacterium]|nr:hypothetical protein [Planctomycetota bacterium]
MVPLKWAVMETPEEKNMTDAYDVVEELVVFEFKATAEVHPIHFMQLKTHVVLAKERLGAVMNLGLRLFKDGFQRFVNGLPQCLVANVALVASSR